MRKIDAGSIVFSIFNYTFFGLLMFVCLYPFYYIFIFSISESSEAIKGITFLPRSLTLQNYSDVFEQPGIPRAALVSLSRTVLGTAITVLCSTFFAYLMTKSKMYFRKLFYRLMVVTMYLNAGLIPYYLTMRAYGFTNNFLVYIIPSAIGAFYVILVKTYIEQLPQALEEAAEIDGAGILTIFFKVIFPLCKPIVATIAVFAAVGQWNSWFDNLIFMIGAPEYNTLQFILYQILNRAAAISNTIDTTTAQSLARQVSPDTIRMTITMIVTFPILFVYPFAQKYFVKGIMIGAIKG